MHLKHFVLLASLLPVVLAGVIPRTGTVREDGDSHVGATKLTSTNKDGTYQSVLLMFYLRVLIVSFPP
ncbi:hypothetical protein PQX77_016898 [Marasmius sp. AFHP31]|nr:hypothetical protein PQX77_016898 [Marasmius sp. AFHP31]